MPMVGACSALRHRHAGHRFCTCIHGKEQHYGACQPTAQSTVRRACTRREHGIGGDQCPVHTRGGSSLGPPHHAQLRTSWALPVHVHRCVCLLARRLLAKSHAALHIGGASLGVGEQILRVDARARTEEAHTQCTRWWCAAKGIKQNTDCGVVTKGV